MDKDAWRRMELLDRNIDLRNAVCAALRCIVAHPVDLERSEESFFGSLCNEQARHLIQTFRLPPHLIGPLRSALYRIVYGYIGDPDPLTAAAPDEEVRRAAESVLAEVATEKDKLWLGMLMDAVKAVEPQLIETKDPRGWLFPAGFDFFQIQERAVAAIRPAADLFEIRSFADFAHFDEADWKLWFREIRAHFRQRHGTSRAPKTHADVDERSLSIVRSVVEDGMSWNQAAEGYAVQYGLPIEYNENGRSSIEDWADAARELRKLLNPAPDEYSLQ